MLHDDILKIKHSLLQKGSSLSSFKDMLNLGKFHSIYTDNDNCTDDLVNSGYEFMDNSFMDLPFENCLFIAENSYYKNKNNITKAAFLVSKNLSDVNIDFFYDIRKKIKTLPDFFFMEMPILDGKISDPFNYICFAWLPRNAVNPEKDTILLSPMPINNQKDIEFVRIKAKAGAAIIVGATMLMNTKYFEHNCVKRDEKMNARRKKNGKHQYEDYTIIDLVDRYANDSGGTHARPKPHWRRGHVRRLPNGDKTCVKPCIINWSGANVPAKQYIISPVKEQNNV